MSKKFLFLSSMAAPYQVKMCSALNMLGLQSEFWFYEHIRSDRPKWWAIPLPKECKILNNVRFKKSGRYLPSCIEKALDEYNPDLIMIGGLSIPGNYLAYKWAQKNKKKIIAFTEMSRDKNGNLRDFSITWKIIKKLYKNIDFIFASNKDAEEQFKNNFLFNEKVVLSRYGADIDKHLEHARKAKVETILFANRLTDIYDPLFALDIFNTAKKSLPYLKLKMNGSGELRTLCEEKIHNLGIESSVEFLDHISNWDSLHKTYQQSDILLLPAKFSNGNLTIIESMASGMGVVISDKVNGHREILTDGENCFICPHGDAKKFTEAILLYATTPQLLDSHAVINKAKVKHLSINGTAKEYIQKFFELNLIKRP